MVDMHVFVQRPVLLTNICALITGFALFGTFVLLPNFVETPRGLSDATARLVNYGFGASATKAGLYLLPSSVTLLFAGPVAGLIGMSMSLWIGAAWIVVTTAIVVSVRDVRDFRLNATEAEPELAPAVAAS
jgi:hypothetical protein